MLKMKTILKYKEKSWMKRRMQLKKMMLQKLSMKSKSTNKISDSII